MAVRESRLPPLTTHNSLPPEYTLPAAVERHYADVRGGEHRRLLQQKKLAQAIGAMREVEAEAIAERKKLHRTTLPSIQAEVGRFAAEIANTRGLVDATATLQLEGGTPANRMAVEAAQLLLSTGVTEQVPPSRRTGSLHSLCPPPPPTCSPSLPLSFAPASAHRICGPCCEGTRFTSAAPCGHPEGESKVPARKRM